MRTDIGLVVTRLPAALHRARREVALEIPQDREVAVEVDADALGSASAGRRTAVLPPPRVLHHAEVAAIGIHLGKEDDVLGLDDLPDLGSREHLFAQTNTLPVAIRAQEPDREVDEDIRSSPLPAVYARDEADGGAPSALALADTDGVTAPLLPGEIGQRDALQVVPMIPFAEDHRPLDLVSGQVAAAPDHVAVAAPLESRRRVPTTLDLAPSRWSRDLLQPGHCVAVRLEPSLLAAVQVCVDFDLAGPPLAVAHHDDAVLRPQLRQVAAVEPGDDDVEKSHDTRPVAPLCSTATTIGKT